MKVLWVLYNTVGSSGIFVGNGKTQGGGWVDATMQELLKSNDVNLSIVAIGDSDKKVVAPSGVTYYSVSKTKRLIGKKNKNEDVVFSKVIDDVCPDIIHVWGTEFSSGLTIAKVAKQKNIPILFYVQGVIQAISSYPNGLIDSEEYRKYIRCLERFKLIKEKAFQKRMEKQAVIEKEMVKISNGIIGDNDWCLAYFDGTMLYRHALPVSDVFINQKHNDEDAEENSIICCAGRGAHKGLHVLIKALPSIKKDFENVKVYIPGNMNSRSPKWLFEPVYITYVKKLIKKLGVSDNIVFCGQLSPVEMAKKMNSCKVFVLPSCIENHSSTLREAMYLGLPSITTMVGSVHEFVRHNENGLIFRYNEHEQLAYFVKRLLGSKEERIRIGKNAYDSIRKSFVQKQDGVIKNIYDNVIKAHKKEL